MKINWYWRLGGFIVGITAMVVLIAWGALSAWRMIGVVEERFATVGQQSFYFAERLQQTLMRLNNLMLRYLTRQQTEDWREFEQNNLFLQTWMYSKRHELLSANERRIQTDLEQVYTEYLAAARRVHEIMQKSGPQGPELAEAMRHFESQSQRMAAKASELANAHRQAQQAVLAELNTTLSKLHVIVIAALLMLLSAGYFLARSVYRDLIAPLRQELVQSRNLLERQQKLASLGVLAAGVAHEIRNPLTAIKARIFTLRKGLKPGSRELTDTEVIDQEINRLERIVKDFLLFARPSDPVLERVPAGRPLEEIERLMRPQLEKNGVHLEVEPPAEMYVQVDLQQIKQVLMNLVQNAAEAAPGGRIVLRARRLQVSLNGRPQPAVSLEVQDNGPGIPEEVQKHLFDPFYSTKEGGTGLGLSIAARLIEKHGGVLHFDTRPQQGTTFKIILPESKTA
ncbi:MAG: ATP-binding protein [Verrucomicrobiae bacterium]|nr:ATP-binding protein [Verrucomicrobiae bacterium]